MGNIRNYLPIIDLSSSKMKKRLGEITKKINTPEQRFILGATAICTQPFIDLYNKKVDEDTRKVSAIRTVAKIIVGTTVGVLVRWGTILAVKKNTKFTLKTINGVKKLLPASKKSLFTPSLNQKDYSKEAYEKYQKAIGSIAGLATMLVTNFVIDAPLTRVLTNTLLSSTKQKKGASKE